MSALTYQEFLAGAAAFAFIGGWLAGMFLGLWAYVTLGM